MIFFVAQKSCKQSELQVLILVFYLQRNAFGNQNKNHLPSTAQTATEHMCFASLFYNKVWGAQFLGPEKTCIMKTELHDSGEIHKKLGTNT